MLDREKMLRLLKINRDANQLSQGGKALDDVIKAIEAGSFDMKENAEQQEIYIHQLRGALGYEVPGHINENPDIKNGIAEALSIQLAEKEEELKRLRQTLEWYGELPCIQENQIGWNVGYVARQALRKETKEAI